MKKLPLGSLHLKEITSIHDAKKYMLKNKLSKGTTASQVLIKMIFIKVKSNKKIKLEEPENKLDASREINQ